MQLGLAAAIFGHLLAVGLATGAFDGVFGALFGIEHRRAPERLFGDAAGRLDGVAAEVIDAAEFNRRYISFDPGRSSADAQPQTASRQQQQQQPTSEPVAPEAAPGDGWAPSRPEPARQNEAAKKALSEAEMRELLAETMADLQASAVAVSTPGAARLGEASPYVRSVIRILKNGMPRSAGLKGTVVIQLVVGQGGGVEAVRVVRSSGVPALDQIVVEAVSRTRIAPPPSTADPRERRFQISYEYR